MWKTKFRMLGIHFPFFTHFFKHFSYTKTLLTIVYNDYIILFISKCPKKCSKNVKCKPNQNIFISITENVVLSDFAEITIYDSNGNLKGRSVTKESKKQVKKPAEKEENTFKYVFSDWSGGEDVETLSKIYLQDLEKFINDGIGKSFIVG